MPGISLASFGTTDALISTYDANPQSRSTLVVVVEGDDDKAILERWFEQDINSGVVAFSTPKRYSQPADVDGCQGVIKVADSIVQPDLLVFGIVDRDHLVMSHRNIFLEPNDETFHSMSPHHPRVRILTHWEIESYLVEPRAIGQYVADQSCDEGASARLDTVLAEVVGAVLLLTAVNIALQDRRKPPYPSLWNLPTTMTRGDMERQILPDVLGSKIAIAEHAAFRSQVSQIESELKAFANTYAPGTSDYNRRILKVIDGKAVFARVLHGLGVKSKSDSPIKRTLARLMGPIGAAGSDARREFLAHIHFFRSYNGSNVTTGSSASA